MAEYIEREAVLGMLKQECSPMVFAYLADLVNAIPAADVRPVVFCKDCKYAERVGMADGCVWCNENLLSRLDEDFCSRGAKMEEPCKAKGE